MVVPSSYLLARRGVLPGHRAQALLRSRHGGACVVRSTTRPSMMLLLGGGGGESNTHSSRRDLSGLASVTSWIRDVVRTKSLVPPNPILQSLKEVQDHELQSQSPSKLLPPFARMLPYHLLGAAEQVARQYHVDLAELEVKITGSNGSSSSNSLFNVLDELDRIEAPILQVLEVGSLFSQLASTPDDMQEWKKSLQTAQKQVSPLPQKESKIIYNALLKVLPSETNRNTDTTTTSTTTHPPSLLQAFQKCGVHLTNPEARDPLRQIHHQLAFLRHRLLQVSGGDYLTSSKATRLQAVSDMYNVIGLSHQQAKLLGFPHVSALELESTSHTHMASLEQIHEMHQQVTAFLQPRIDNKVKVKAKVSAGAFLPQQDTGPTDDEKALWEGRRSVKKLLLLNGVIQGLQDLAGGLLGIKVEEDTTDSESTWHKDVRLFHLYDNDNADADDNSSTHSKYLGSFYMDPYQRQDKSPHNKTRLFTRRNHQTSKPVVIMALNITPPSWDDNPSPLSWEETRSVLYEFGKALQLILTQTTTVEQGQGTGTTIPVDVSEFLANFMELWLQNDGFVKRLGELSQDQFTFPVDLMEILRKETVNQKVDEIMQNVFLGSLESTIFTNFDPRGDETLVALQGRLAEQYIPHILPDTDDLSPLLQVFQESAVDDQSMTAYSYLWSELLSANVFEKFSKTDMKDKDEIQRLGRAVRHLFLRENGTHLTINDFEELCGKPISSQALQDIYNF